MSMLSAFLTNYLTKTRRAQKISNRFSEKTDAQIISVRRDMDVRFEQVDKRFEQAEESLTDFKQETTKRFDKLESEFDRVQCSSLPQRLH
ncbi:hypothetical protein SK355_02420 [Candidatus Fukatsuia symbiotica]|uniref:Uncharacterized protein n=1 Tax=Candidatus Fukatsuia symbiotica TaxID=1878942 RepID=A0A2U8I549_9GAMM|nr:hypothetical protein [Candidatus Fukatsuia symbiotica]AWK13315.1 hypothetical protein CCS41_00500 [Candidatus Fukatsuia symbiotica]MEA9444190.1 hypothetical protein [Candidatus Fukatsuia symbiotica]